MHKQLLANVVNFEGHEYLMLDASSDSTCGLINLETGQVRIVFNRALPTPHRQLIAKDLPVLRSHLGTSFISMTIGTDSEFWCRRTPKGQMIPAFDILPPSKDEDDDDSNPIFYDGFQGEFRTPAHYCLQELCGSIKECLSTIAEHYKIQISLESTQPLLDSHFALPKRYLALGCSPSKNIYGMRGNLGIEPQFIPVRFAGCHMHFGFPSKYRTSSTYTSIVRQLDRIAGVCMTTLFGHLEDPIRRQYYGLAGEYRIKSYGLEYRVPAALVMAHPRLYMLCFELGRLAVYSALSGLGPLLWKASDEETIEAINSSNQILAREIIGRNADLLKYWAQSRFKDSTTTMYALANGIDKVIPRLTTNVLRNWRLYENTYMGPHYSWGEY